MPITETTKPFSLHFGEVLPTPVKPACIYDPREQRCVLEAHHSLDGFTIGGQDNTRSDYTPWTGDEGGP
ncbi:hypothetical protein HYW17_05285 [Candidatus Uhrbacteria bacterium]|nr:hypothetical protein [Candidatus Uhrbacteria bacterium]